MPWDARTLPEFTWQPEYPFTKSPIWRSSLIQFPSGMEQRPTLQTAVRYSFLLQFPHLERTEIQNMYDFFVGREGRRLPFRWYDDLDNTLRFVRFDMEECPIELFTYVASRIGISLIEVHSSEIIFIGETEGVYDIL